MEYYFKAPLGKMSTIFAKQTKVVFPQNITKYKPKQTYKQNGIAKIDSMQIKCNDTSSSNNTSS